MFHRLAVAAAALSATVLACGGAAAGEAPGGGAEEAERFGAFGLGSQDYWITAPQFTPRSSTPVLWGDRGELYYASNTQLSQFVAQIELPAGAVMTQLQCFFYDTTPQIAFVSLVNFRYNYAAQVPQSVLVAQMQSQDGGYHSPATTLNETVKYRDGDYRNVYVLVATMPNDNNVRLRGCRIFWHRSVAPAPATATFGDVPTTHPQFRFVEALLSAGITAGCGAGSFCPDAPLTRGQMAVFLSAALGLHFPY